MAGILTHVNLSVDPTGYYSVIPKSRIKDSLGLIPQIVERAVTLSKNEIDLGYKIWDVYQYGTPMLPSETKSGFKDGLLTYPGEEPEHPIAVYRIGNTDGIDIEFWQYERAMTVYTVNGEAKLIGRMD
jgi:hypothetical protein|nr:MAG TPA: hypothetical protein [Caudoviricetes sp.]